MCFNPLNTLLTKILARPGGKTIALSTLLILPLLSCAQTEDEVIKAEPAEPKFKLSLTGIKPHAQNAFTQGLFFWRGNLYESSGLRGKSAIFKYSADKASISVNRRLEDRYFAEGATAHKGKIYQLTWTSGKALVYQGAMLSPMEGAGFTYEGEGWGLTSDGENLWLSDGTDELRVLDTQGRVLRRLEATYNGQPLDRLNELEWIDGWLLANRWHDHRIYIINPHTGKAEGAFNLSNIVSKHQNGNKYVLNGIAWNPETQKLWITGKHWDRFYLADIRLPEIKPTSE